MESWKAYLFTQDKFQKFLIVFSNHNGLYLGILTIASPSPEENFSGLGLGSGSRLELVLGLEDNQTIAPEENSSPS